jgi:ACT domain-containing protein
LAVLRTQSHFADVMTQQKRERTTVSSAAEREVSEVTRCLDKIGAAKCSIISLFQEIAAENKDDRPFPQLEADADESGLIDVDEVSLKEK